MSKLKCNECGQIFDSNQSICPNCGCPASECEKVEENTTSSNERNNVLYNYHADFNEKVPYSPFSPDYHLFKDPAFLAKYPLGEFERKHPFWGWLFGPWYLTCKDEKLREHYDVINNIFYAFNLSWKMCIYPGIWTFFKMWQLIALFIALYVATTIFSPNSNNESWAWLFGILNAFLTFVYILGIGKSLHRYWPQFHKVFRRLCKRFVNSMRQ